MARNNYDQSRKDIHKQRRQQASAENDKNVPLHRLEEVRDMNGAQARQAFEYSASAQMRDQQREQIEIIRNA